MAIPMRDRARDLCACGHQRAAHRKSESAQVSAAYAGELPKNKTDCALCYCAHFKMERRALAKPSTAEMLPKIPGRTFYRRSGSGMKSQADTSVRDERRGKWLV
jgi:hypothetical protein